MKKTKRMAIITTAVLLAVTVTTPAMADTGSSGRTDRFTENRPLAVYGRWIDKENLVWKFDDGETATIGTGPKFSDVHPDITDPEYYFKGYVLYPGESMGTVGIDGNLKANYPEYPEDFAAVQQFLQESDWIHKTEAERFWMIYDRLSNGRHGNEYGAASRGGSHPFSVLAGGIGVCKNYAAEIQRLANYMGLEAVVNAPYYKHVVALVKVNGQWLYTDGSIDTVSGVYPIEQGVFPVDYVTEYGRYEKELLADGVMDQIEYIKSWDEKLFAGEITWMEYFRAVNPGVSDETIQSWYPEKNLNAYVTS